MNWIICCLLFLSVSWLPISTPIHSGSPTHQFLGVLCSLKFPFSDPSLILPRGQTFITLFRLPSPFLLFPYFIGKMKAIMYDIPQTQGLLFMKYTPPHLILPYFLLHPGRGIWTKFIPLCCWRSFYKIIMWGEMRFPQISWNPCFHNFPLLDHCLGNYGPIYILIIGSHNYIQDLLQEIIIFKFRGKWYKCAKFLNTRFHILFWILHC